MRSIAKYKHKIQSDGDFWNDLNQKLISDPDSVKLMIKNGVMTIHDIDEYGRTVMMHAAKRGCYEMVQFCINCGADIDVQDENMETALDHARENGYCNIEQLILFAQLNANIGNDIKLTAETMHKQYGVIDNILNELTEIGQQSKELFEKILMELMINIVNKRLSFSDNLLNLCWKIACRDNKDPLSSDLWKTISAQSNSIIQSGNKRDWYWLKNCLLPSTVLCSSPYLYTR